MCRFSSAASRLSALLLVAICVAILGMAARSAAADGAREVSWHALMPEGWQPPELPPVDHSVDPAFEQDFAADFALVDAPTVATLDQQQLKIPGFVIPTKYQDERVIEFLLVPYLGACIHVPPPPANQMVYVKLREAWAAGELWEPVWVSGVMRVQTAMTAYAVAGYTLVQAETEPYTF